MTWRKHAKPGSHAVLLLGTVLGVVAYLPGATADAPRKAAERQHDTDDADGRLPVGQKCVVVLEQADGQTELEGVLREANARWFVLRRGINGRVETGVPMLSKVPYVSRLYKNVGVGRTDETVWIPRDRVLYVRVQHAALERAPAEGEIPVEGDNTPQGEAP